MNVDMKGKFIGVSQEVSVFTVRRRFQAHAGRARLRATALGVYFAELNGERVGDAYLAPGWTSYRHTLQVQEYEVQLREGENELALTVGEGWFCGPLTWNRRAKVYGDRPAVCCELTGEGVSVATDTDWTASESHIRASGLYDGERVDLTAPLRPLQVIQVACDKACLVMQECEPVRDICRVPVRQVLRTPKGELVYDFGQNLVGVAEVRTPETFDGTLTLRFAEILVDGNFYTDNLRSARATDTFTARGAHTFRSEFTFHGFRYMKLEGDELPAQCVTAIVRHTDMRRTGHIGTSDAQLARLLENVVWGQRGNFVDVPTDCPQRDERLGWTGDINVFGRTAAYNYDVRGILKKWLRDVCSDQTPEGDIPSVVPDCLGEQRTAAMWADVVTMLPHTLYEMYGDVSFLAMCYPAMRKFVLARERTMENGLIARGFEWGDWLALDKEVLLEEGPFGRTDVYFIANVLHAHSLGIVSETARILGEAAQAKEYRLKREALVRRIRREYFTAGGRLAFDTVTAQVLALHFGIAAPEARARLAAQLNDNVLRHGCRISTGFIGTPYLLFALADNGYFDTAEKVLFNPDFPGWMYEVSMGATTVWERWNSLLPDGTPNPDGMNSYNHYAYGSVMEFVYRRIAGIEAAAPGFSAVRIAPMPLARVDRVHAEYESVSGRIAAGYERTGEAIVYTAEIPEGVRAELALPGEPPVPICAGKHTWKRNT